MKKIILSVLLTLSPISAFAAFDENLRYGMKGDSVIELQEFLQEQGVFKGEATGNFYSLTLSAVKKFQSLQGIKPVSGYWGPISRATANKILAIEDSEGEVVIPENPVDLSQKFPINTTPAPAQIAPNIPNQVISTPESATTTAITVKNASAYPTYSNCGGTAIFKVFVLDQFGNQMRDKTVTYTSSAPSNKSGTVATSYEDADGIFGRVNYVVKGVTEGTISMVFSVNGISTTTSFLITPAPEPKPAYCF